jgi:two-component system response regulator WspF
MKIGIISDAPREVDILRRVLSLAPEHQIAWVSGNASEAFGLCDQATPDLVLIDLTLTGMDAIEATRRIVSRNARTVLIMTRSVDRNAARVFEAMRQGALDAAEFPSPETADLRVAAAPLLAKIAMINKLMGAGDKSAIPRGSGAGHQPRALMVAIGASAGGPAALAALLEDLRPDFPGSVVIVQHVDARFAAGMADWLGQQSRLPVRLAGEGDRLVPGTVMIAGTNDHLVLKSPDRLGYVAEPSNYAYRPSIDVFFRSVVALWRGDVVGVLLTGMGADGAKGLSLLRAGGHHTIAQDQASSAVYGMPKAAATANAAVEILPLRRIALRLSALAREGRPSERNP